MAYQGRRLGYVLVAAKDDGLKCEFAEVKYGALNPILEGGSFVNLEHSSDEDLFVKYLDHCLRFAC